MARRMVTLVPLDKIRPARSNVKQHDLALTGESIDRFGLIEIPVIDGRTDRLVAGHGRLDTLKRAFKAKETPPGGVTVDRSTKMWMVPVLTGWASADDDEAVAAAIALNRVGEKGGWDTEGLLAQLDQLRANDVPMTGLGFDQADVDDLLASLQEGPLTFDASHDSTQDGWSVGAAGAQRDPTYEEQAVKYRVKGIRSFILDYALDEFEVIATQFVEARRRLDLDSNAAVLARLLGDFLA